MTTPGAAARLCAWIFRLLMIAAGVTLGLVLSAGTAQADSPLDLGKTADKVAESVRKSTSSVTKSPATKTHKVVHRVTKPVRQVTRTVHRVSKPVQRVEKPVQRASRAVHRASKPVRHVAKSVRHTVRRDKATPKHETSKPRADKPKAGAGTTVTKSKATAPRAAKPAATNPATKTAPATKPVLSSVVTRTTALTGTLTSSVSAGLGDTDRALTDTATPLVTTVTRQLPNSLRTVVDDDVLRPVVAAHDTAIGLVDTTLVVTVPAVVASLTTPLLPVLDEVEASLPGGPGSPLAPPPVTAPVPGAAPVDLGVVGSLPGPSAPTTSASRTPSGPAAARTARSTAALLTLPDRIATMGSDLRDDVTAATVSTTAATAAAGIGLLGDLVGHGAFGVGPSGSASATALGLTLLALASAGAFGAGSARSPRITGLLHQGPFRRAHRPGFSPD